MLMTMRMKMMIKKSMAQTVVAEVQVDEVVVFVLLLSMEVVVIIRLGRGIV